MNIWTIGDVEEITGVKSHILRYWEEVIPSFAPKKDIGGRRIYTPHDIQKVMRLKYLIQEKKFTIEGARNQLIIETAEIYSQNNIEHEINKDKRPETLQKIEELRSDLLDIYTIIKNYRKIDGEIPK